MNDLTDFYTWATKEKRGPVSLKGDVPGHEFHGNQYTEGGGGGESSESIGASAETIHPGYSSLFTGPSKSQMDKLTRNKKAQEEFMKVIHEHRSAGKEPSEEEATKLYKEILQKWGL